MNIHFEYIDRIIVAEAKRTDSNRVIDVSTVVLANEKAIAQASALAIQVVSSDEAIRILIENINNQLDQRVTVLEKSRYENEGRKGLSASLLMMIAGLLGGLIVFIVQKIISL
ncbi:hypothetical protein [Clostridium psychrophilum]|uniref:hypothetical protein n=1 Tax=Clostridium psychrophilum TaxID=132926 RepID=UPI001C0D1CDC|nr:hypothetical protein [Clostridium psychrophilum]MBU3182432.1 hypothetical protein [Clostridium psychrophilum]